MISLYDILEAADGQLFGDPAAQIFTDLTADVRRVTEGCLFVALKTEYGDGHRDLQEAARRGATGLICSRPPDFDTSGVTVLIVRYPEQALARWAHLVLSKFGTTVIGVSGAAGKSTSKAVISAILGTQYEVYQSPGCCTGRISLALALGKLTEKHQLAVIEMDSDQPDEMAAMLEITQPLVGVMTSAGYADEPLNALGQTTSQGHHLIKALPEGGLAVLNFDDVQCRALADQTAVTVFSVGIDSFYADLLAYNIVVGRYRTGFDLRYGGERFVGRWAPLLGRHQVYSVMAALAVGLSYQIGIEEALEVVTRLDQLPGRLRPFKGINEAVVVDDSFSGSVPATRAALEWLGSIREEGDRLVFVMGDLDLPGSLAQRAYHALGVQIAGVADVLVTQGNLAATAARAALDAGMPRRQVRMSFSHHDTANLLRDLLGPRDIMLVKGGAAARMEQIIGQLLADQTDTAHLPRQETYWLDTWAEPHTHTSWVEVDMNAIAQNVRQVDALLERDVALMAVVEGDAYGHGAVSVASTAMLNGADYLGVSTLSEAVELRDAGLDGPILVLGYLPVWAIRDALYYNLSVSIYDVQMARLYNQVASEMHRLLRVHINVDTGLGHLGLLPQQVTHFFRSMKNLHHLEVEGIYTRLATAASDRVYAREQLEAFRSAVNGIRASGINIHFTHAAGTAALLTLPESHFTLVRCRSALYGVAPAPTAPLPPGFMPALQWKTVIAQVRDLPRGSYVGEEGAYRTSEQERIAVIPVGYTDGFRNTPAAYPDQQAGQWPAVLVRGQRTPVVGRVGARETTINVTGVPGAQSGDEVVLLGRQETATVTADEVAARLGIHPLELLGSIVPRLRRV